MNKEQLAKIVSWLTGMHIWFPILLIVTLFKTGLTIQQIEFLAPILFFFTVIIPSLYVILALRLGWVSAWDLPKREERHTFFLITLISTVISMCFVYVYGTKLFFSLSVILLVQMIVLAVVTRFWKISLHASLVTTSTITINFFFHWQLPYLYLLIPLVAWARLALKRHTLGQIILGIIVTAMISFIGLKILGYL